jgi:hypothetical protein
MAPKTDYAPPMKIYGEIIKKEDTKIVVSLQQYGKGVYLDIREQWKPEGADWVPTKKGFTISEAEPGLALADIDKLIEMLQAAKKDIPDSVQ